VNEWEGRVSGKAPRLGVAIAIGGDNALAYAIEAQNPMRQITMYTFKGIGREFKRVGVGCCGCDLGRRRVVVRGCRGRFLSRSRKWSSNAAVVVVDWRCWKVRAVDRTSSGD